MHPSTLPALTLALLLPLPAIASGAGADPVTPVVLALATILISAKLGGDICSRRGQPPVLGELLIGVALGNAAYLGISWFEPMKADHSMDVLARLGVVLLLFQVGLESTVGEMMKVGWVSLLVAVLGVVTPFALGWGVSALVLPLQSIYVHVFIGATLTATSVGITARVLKDLGKSQAPESRIILGAAVIDDVLGLIILAVVSGVIQSADGGGSLSLAEIGMIMLKATGFLLGALVIGVTFSPRLFWLASRLEGHGVLLASALSVCFLFAYVASMVGLAPIVGAYAAGLVLENVHFQGFRDRGEHELDELLEPLASFLVPIFFVMMGMQVDLASFAKWEVLSLAMLITLAAILGKQACSLATLGRGLDSLSVGIGMIPRGEVGLIFANIGLGLTIGGKPVVDSAVYSAIVVMVIATTLVTPPALKWSLSRGSRRDG
jgi:Kef-type K+ transport system membrane component KefB